MPNAKRLPYPGPFAENDSQRNENDDATSIVIPSDPPRAESEGFLLSSCRKEGACRDEPKKMGELN
ncbi:MAG: hypothetical protein DMG31_11510 [Acidobacteria bacterium]|nr:MAG: hypothetical protein DMG31_11510 [Acidobacteriota bacterium]